MDKVRHNTGRMTPCIVIIVTLNVLRITWGQGSSNSITTTPDPFDPFAFSFGEPNNPNLDQSSLDQKIESWASGLISGNSKILEEIQNAVNPTSPSMSTSSNTNQSNHVNTLPEGFNFLSDPNRGPSLHTGSLDTLNQGMINEFGSLPPIPSLDSINGDLFLPIDSGTLSGTQQSLPSENETSMNQNMFKLPTIDQLGISADIFDFLSTTPPPTTSPPFVISQPTSNQATTDRNEILNNLPPIPSLEELGLQGNNNNLMPPDISSKTGQDQSQAGNAVDNMFHPDILSPSTNTGSTNEQGWGNMIDPPVSPQGETHIGSSSAGGIMGNSHGFTDSSHTGNLLDNTMANTGAPQNNKIEHGWGNKLFDSSPNTVFQDSQGGLLPVSTSPIPLISTTTSFLFGGNMFENTLNTEGHTESVSSGNHGGSEIGGFFDSTVGTTSLPASNNMLDASSNSHNNAIIDQTKEMPGHTSLDTAGQNAHQSTQPHDPNAQRRMDQEIWNTLIPPLPGNQNARQEPTTLSPIVPSPPPEILITGGFSEHLPIPDIPTIDQISGTNSNTENSVQTSGSNLISNNEQQNTNTFEKLIPSAPTNEHVVPGEPNIGSGGLENAKGNNINSISNQNISTDLSNFNQNSLPGNNIQNIGFRQDVNNMNNNLNSVDNSLFGTQPFDQIHTDTGSQSNDPNMFGGHNNLGSTINQNVHESPNSDNVHSNVIDGSHSQHPTIDNVPPQESNFLFQNNNNNISPNELPPIPSIEQISNQDSNFGVPPSGQQSNVNENANTGPTTTAGPLQRMWNELALDSILNTAVNSGQNLNSVSSAHDSSHSNTNQFHDHSHAGSAHDGSNIGHAQNSNTFGFGSSNNLLVDPNTPRQIGDHVSIQVDNHNSGDQRKPTDSGQSTGFTFIDPSSSTVIEAQSNEKFLNFITDPNPPRTGSTFTDINISPSIGLPLDPFAGNANENPTQTITSNANENQMNPFASNTNENQIDPFAANANENQMNPFASNTNENQIDPFASNANANQMNPFASNANENQMNPFSSNANENQVNPFASNTNENQIDLFASNTNQNQIDPFASNTNQNQMDPFASNANQNNVQPTINGVPSTAVSPTDPFAEEFPTNPFTNNISSSNLEVSPTSDLLFDPFAQDNMLNPFGFNQNENVDPTANNEIHSTPSSPTPTETHSSNHNEVQPDVFGLNTNENNLEFLGLNTDPNNFLLTVNESQPTEVLPTEPASTNWIPPTAESAINNIANANPERSPLVLFDIRDNQPGHSGQPTSQSIEITPTDRFLQDPSQTSNQGFSNFGSENMVQNVNPPPTPTIAVPSPMILTNNQRVQQFTGVTNNQNNINNQIVESRNNPNLVNRFQSQSHRFSPQIRQQTTSPNQNRMTTMSLNVNPNRLFLNPNTVQTTPNSFQNQARQNLINRLQRIRQNALLAQMRNRLQNNNVQNRFQNQRNPSSLTTQGQTQNQNTRFQNTISRFQNTQNTARQQLLQNQNVRNTGVIPTQQQNRFQTPSQSQNAFQNLRRQPNSFMNQRGRQNVFQNQVRQPNALQNQARQQNSVQNQRSQTNRFQNLSRQQQIRLIQLLRQHQARRQTNNNQNNLQNRQVQQQTFRNLRGSNVNQNQRLQNTIRNQAAGANSNINRNQLFQNRLQNQASQFTNTNQRQSNQFGQPVNSGAFNNRNVQNVQQRGQMNVVNTQVMPRPTQAAPSQTTNPALRDPRVLLPLVQLLRARANGQMRNNVPLQRALLQQLLRLRSLRNSNSSAAGGLANQLPLRRPTQFVPIPVTSTMPRPGMINDPTRVPNRPSLAAMLRGAVPNRRPFDFATPFQSNRFVDFSLPFERSIQQIVDPTPDALTTAAPTPNSPPLDLSIPITALSPTVAPAFEVPRINQLRPTPGRIIPRGPVAIPISEAFQRIERMRFLSRDSNPFRETAAMNFPFGNANPLQTGVLSLRPVGNFPSVLQDRQRLIVPLTRPSPTRAPLPIQRMLQPGFGDPRQQLRRDGSWSWLGQQVRFLSDQGAL